MKDRVWSVARIEDKETYSIRALSGFNAVVSVAEFNQDAADVVSANSTETEVSAYLADAEHSLAMLHK